MSPRPATGWNAAHRNYPSGRPKKTAKPVEEPLESWWLRPISREAFMREASSRFTLNPPLGVVVRTNGVMDPD